MDETQARTFFEYSVTFELEPRPITKEWVDAAKLAQLLAPWVHMRDAMRPPVRIMRRVVTYSEPVRWETPGPAKLEGAGLLGGVADEITAWKYKTDDNDKEGNSNG